MKVPRYLYGQSNIAQLRDMQSNLIKSGEAAAQAAAPYQAVEGAARSISNDLFMMQERENKLREREAMVNEKLAFEKLKLGITEMENDPAFQNQMQENGEPTAKVMLDLYEKMDKAYLEEISKLEDPKVREEAMKFADVRSKAIRLSVRKMVNDRRESWNIQGEFDLRNFALEARDYETFNQQNRLLVEQGHITPEQYDRAERIASAQKIDDTSNIYLDEYVAAYQAGAGPQYYAAMVESDIPQDVKDAAITKIENQQTNFEKIEARQRAEKEVDLIDSTTDMLMAIKTGSVHEDINSWEMNQMAIAGNDPLMQKKVKNSARQLRLAQISGVKDDGDWKEFQYNFANGIYQNVTKQNQEFLDRMIKSGITPDMSEEDMIKVSVNVQRQAGFLSYDTEELFGTAVREDNKLAGAAPLWAELMMNPDVSFSMETNLPPEKQTVLTDTAKNIKSGIPSLEAAQIAIKNLEDWQSNKEVMKSRVDFYTSDKQGQTAAQDGFEELIDNVYDSTSFISLMATRGGSISLTTDPFGQGEFTFEGLGRDAMARYEQYFYNAFMQTNDFETARMQADLQFTNLHSLNNLNGEWTVELNGVKGDVNRLRQEWIAENKDESVLYTDASGLVESTLGNLDELKLVNPMDTDQGKKYEVWNGNVPVMKDVVKIVDGQEVVTREQVFKTIETSAQDKLELERLRTETAKEIKRLEDEYKAAEKAEKFQSIYGREENKKILRNNPNKIKLAEANLRKAEEEANPDQAAIAQIGF